MNKESKNLYANQSAWRELQEFLPERLRLKNDEDLPLEEFWDWKGNQIHLDRYLNPNAPAKVILHHGVGTNGRQLMLIIGKVLADRGWEVTALDNLGYGMTQVAKGYTPGYDDWVQLATDYVAHEKSRDDRPIVLYGLSAGGMLTYHVASRAPKGSIAGIVGMTFLDQRISEVANTTAHDPLTARFGPKIMGALSKTPLRGFRYPMTLASKMTTLVNNKEAMKVLLRDKTSANNAMWIKFLAEYMTFNPDVEYADFDRCPILLTQPSEDRWTPRRLSVPVLSKITKVSVETVMLENAGHYPLEDPGLLQMKNVIDSFVRKVCGQ